jgi:protein-S-isoprenylcysteine O-methyltransferase Ste14
MNFQVIALVILAVFYGAYFIKMFMQKKKGIKTDQLGKGKTGLVKVIETILKIITFILPAVELISILLNTALLQGWPRILGICIGIIGNIVFIISLKTMKDSWRAGVSNKDKTELVTKGIYAISRNPAFLAFDLIYIGILLMFFNWILFLLSLFAIVMLHIQIVKVEEEFLVTTFGEEYLDYKKKVNRYLGKNF